MLPWHQVAHATAILKAIKSSKASGPDGIPPKLIKEFAYELSSPLTDVLNCSFREGVVPHQWKSTIVVPIPKQYPPSVDKMRPLSLTDIFAKIAEGFIAKWVVQDIQDSVDINQCFNCPLSAESYGCFVSGSWQTKEYVNSSPHRLLQGFWSC